MISLRHQFLFIHIKKTAGNSITSVLGEYSEDRMALKPWQDGVESFGLKSDLFGTGKHTLLQQYREVLRTPFFAPLYKFSVVRNPWERLVSLYFSSNYGSVTWNREAFLRLIDKEPSMSSYLASYSDVELQTDYQTVDEVIRFESLEDDFVRLCDRLELPHRPLPHRNQSSHLPYTQYYDQALIEIVAHKYRQDIQRFGYEFSR